MNKHSFRLDAKRAGCAQVLGVAALFMLTTLAQAQWTPTYTATWTGNADNNWYNEGNWSWADSNMPAAQALSDAEKTALGYDPEDEVLQVIPDADTAVIFTNLHPPVSFIDLSAEGSSSRSVGSILFTGDMPAGALTLDRSGAGSMDWTFSSGIEVEAGAPAISFRLGGSGTIGGSDIRFVNNSSELLQLGERTNATTFRVDGSGDIGLESTINRGTHHVILEDTFSGSFFPSLFQNRSSITLNGGTMVLDRRIENELDQLDVNNATLTGNGRIGAIRYEETHARHGDNEFNMNDGAIVDPGRVGEVGALTFENYPVNFNEGSTLRLDLYSVELDAEDNVQYDRLLFDLTGDAGNIINTPTVHLDTDGDGVRLSLNLLPGFAPELEDVFTILSGYSSLTGHFKLADGTDLLDGTEFEEDGTLFRINYNNPSVTLTVIPEPGAGGLLLLGLAGMLCWRRR